MNHIHNHSKKLLFILFIAGFNNLQAQFLNGNFASGSPSGNVITNWTNGSTQYVAADAKQSEWIDLTGNGFGNGNYIEQTVHTSKNKKYQISFDLGSFYGWDLWDAGVSVTLNGKALGSRIFHDSFSYSYDPRLHWERMHTIAFIGTGSPVTVRFTGDSKMVASYGFGSGVGVIGFDNVSLDSTGLAGIKQEETKFANFHMNVYPNPASNSINLTLPASNLKNVKFELIDVSGKIILEGEQSLEGNVMVINASNIPDGVYFVQLYQDSQRMRLQRVVMAHQ